MYSYYDGRSIKDAEELREMSIKVSGKDTLRNIIIAQTEACITRARKGYRFAKWLPKDINNGIYDNLLRKVFLEFGYTFQVVRDEVYIVW